jgi:hypothetical protein
MQGSERCFALLALKGIDVDDGHVCSSTPGPRKRRAARLRRVCVATYIQVQYNMHSPWRGSPCRHLCHVGGSISSMVDGSTRRPLPVHPLPLLVFSDQLLITEKCIFISVSELLQTAAAPAPRTHPHQSFFFNKHPHQSHKSSVVFVCFRFFYGQ